LVLLIGLFFQDKTLGLYLCTFVPFLILIYQNKGVLKINSILIFAVIFLANICFQTLVGYPPNIKLTLNFLGNLIMIYSIFGLLQSEIVLTKYLKGLITLQVVVVAIILVLGIAVNGQNFYLNHSNYIYTSLDRFVPVLEIQKQILAPFIFLSSIMAIYYLKPRKFWRNVFVIGFILNALFMSFASRSIIAGLVITAVIFILRRYLSKVSITSIAVIVSGVGVGAATVFLESYMDIIRLIDIRGIVYVEIIGEIIKHPLGIGYGNTISYLLANNASIFSEASFYLDDLRNSNESFSQFPEFETFPINIESSLLIGTLEQGVLMTGFFYSLVITKIARMFYSDDKLIILYTVGLSVVFFTALTEDNFLLVPFLFYMALFFRIDQNRREALKGRI